MPLSKTVPTQCIFSFFSFSLFCANLVHEVDGIALLLSFLVHVAIELDGVPRVPHVRAALDFRALQPAEVRHLYVVGLVQLLNRGFSLVTAKVGHLYFAGLV